MKAYRAFYRRGRIVPVGEPAIPEGSELIITVLDLDSSPDDDDQEKQKTLRLEWLERLHAAVNFAEGEPFELIPHSATMKEPLLLND